MTNRLIAFAAALLLSATACTDILDREPLTDYAAENAFSDATGAEAALTAVYNDLQIVYSFTLNNFVEMASDNTTSTNGDVIALDRFTWESNLGDAQNIWNDAYTGINHANQVIANIGGVPMDATRRAAIEGEARFLRALFFFNLVRLYGGVPLRVTPGTSPTADVAALPRASEADVYAQILADLNAAADLLPNSSGTNPIRVNRNAVLALRAKVHLTQRNWALALADAQAVNGYTLESTPEGLYPAKNDSPESILEVQSAGTEDGPTIGMWLWLPRPPAPYDFPKFSVPSLNFVAAMDTINDLRYTNKGVDANGNLNYTSMAFRPIYPDEGEGNRGWFMYKWRNRAIGDGSIFPPPAVDNNYVLRYADVLLIAAEAANESSGPAAALPFLNQVRTRADLTPLTTTDAPTAAALRPLIAQERRAELAFEGERWFDLLRYHAYETSSGNTTLYPTTALDVIVANQAGSSPTSPTTTRYLRLPIPQRELDLNPSINTADQNPGY